MIHPWKKLIQRAVAIVACCLLPFAIAQAGTISYSIDFAENLDVMQHPDNPYLAKIAANKPQHTLMLARTNPFMELMNTSDDEAFITQFTMTIGDATKNFDWARMVETSPGVTFSLSMPDTVAGGLHTELLVINFTGFGKGDFVRFRLGLAPDAENASAIMDYRNVFFRMNGGADTSGNSTVNVSFANNDGTATLTNQLPNFVNNNKFTSTNLDFLTTYCGMDSIVPFVSQGQGTIPIPEPGSVVLWSLGLAGLASCGWRKRRRRVR